MSKISLVYFAGGNRLETLKKICTMPNVDIKKICVASIESNIDIYRNFASSYGVPFYILNKQNISDLLADKNEDILLSIGYRFIIPRGVFGAYRYAINIHPTLLPKYKGAYSGFAIIENGELETGITAHFIDDGVDTGDIIGQIKIPLTRFDTINTMSKKVISAEPAFVEKVLRKVISNNFVSKSQEIIDQKVYSKKRMPEDSKINPEKSLLDLYNKIRACDQDRFPAYFELDGKIVKIRLEFEE